MKWFKVKEVFAMQYITIFAIFLNAFIGTALLSILLLLVSFVLFCVAGIAIEIKYPAIQSDISKKLFRRFESRDLSPIEARNLGKVMFDKE